jgi:hypothetical protein
MNSLVHPSPCQNGTRFHSTAAEIRLPRNYVGAVDPAQLTIFVKQWHCLLHLWARKGN